ncbi:hypothetical protein Cpap_0194 [Ruminiclostridium papyrosolvens DSM 2782]|uniref:Uncharacterized protein n=1 Tax=Ruminiclostridium papyrosolvens DSM 2782 TaxID=588581 RepID=F1TIK8_9FIRM|nr:hypothetical protein [Ruminiclostridium papyrosolvens]EGD45825.1 hypothetical protein Cpap_0194 [Ruminiclostridium papyrosolvens DSM 2782]WES33855.1 hypothetical protein P0092_19125 [Ruminiclostridium papyrosolvens DSM 2782]
MSMQIYTYSNPYEIDREPFWNLIKNCPQFCVSQTMVNGLSEIYLELRHGKLSTVDRLVTSLYDEWYDNTELYIEQYATIDNIISKDKGISEDIRRSLSFNKKDLLDSIRLLCELGIEVNKIDRVELSRQQLFLVGLYNRVIKSYGIFKFDKERKNTQIEAAIKSALMDANKGSISDEINTNTIVFHGIHQFTPMILKSIEEVSKYKNVVLLFNYQQQYKNIYQTWIDVYSAFDIPLHSQFNNEFKATALLPLSYQGNLLGEKIGQLSEGSDKLFQAEFSNISVLEFDNVTEFAGYVAEEYESAAKIFDEANDDEKQRRSVLFYMKEQFYSVNNEVNDILKIYFPEQFGERHFLSYPIGQFFIAIADMWNEETGELLIKNMNSIVECLNSGIIVEERKGELVSVFNKTSIYFSREENIEAIISKLKALQIRIKRIGRKSLRNDSNEGELSRLNYYNVSVEELSRLITGLEELNEVAHLFYEDFEQEEANFKTFYSRVKEFIQNKILIEDKLEKDFKDIIVRLLSRLEKSERIKTSGTFSCLKETMSFYLKQESKKGNSANWIVRDFEQIDGDVLKSINQPDDIIYHFCCVSDADMSTSVGLKMPWPLDLHFFELAYLPYDWKYQVFIKSLKEYKSFKKYALVYGLLFNRRKFKLSYVKNENEICNEMYYAFKILGLRPGNSPSNEKNSQKQKVKVNQSPLKVDMRLESNDYYRWRICKYRFALESIIEGGTKYKEKFLILKYMEVLIENYVREELQGKRYLEQDLDKTLDDSYESIKEKFQFAIELDKIDIIARAKRYIIENIVNPNNNIFPVIDDNSLTHMRKKCDFINVKLSREEDKDTNILRDKLRTCNQKEIDAALNNNTLINVDFTTSVDLWCQYCANREICLECFKVIAD